MMSVITELKQKIAALEGMLGTATVVVDAVTKKRGRPSKKATEEKPKREISDGMKVWHAFNARIDLLLKGSDAPFKRVAEAKQFASKLKKAKAVGEWTDEEILAARKEWADEHKPLCPVCLEDAVESDVLAHKSCVKRYATDFVDAGKGTASEALADWSMVSGITAAIAERTKVVVGEKKGVGRPKMTEEEKAAAKAARAAIPAVVTPTKKSKLGPAPGAPKKSKPMALAESMVAAATAPTPRIAWEEEAPIKTSETVIAEILDEE